MNGCINCHNCVYWAPENPKVTIDVQVNLPRVSVWCPISSECIVGPLVLDGSVTAQTYLAMLKLQLLPSLQQQDSAEGVFFQKNEVPAHCSTLLQAWISMQGLLEWPPRLPVLTPPNIFLRDVLKKSLLNKAP